MELSRDNLHELPQLLDEIHDKYFALDMVRHDRRNCVFRLPFGASKWGPYERSLEIFGVYECFIRDTVRIGIYCLNVLSFEMDTLTIRIHCDTPLDISLKAGPDFRVVVR